MFLTTMDGSEKETIVNFGKIKNEQNIFPNALVCWYKVFFNEKEVETYRKDSFMNHMALLMPDTIKKDEDLKIKIEQVHDIVRINVL